MADPWIKMRTGLVTAPKVRQLAKALDLSGPTRLRAACVVGLLQVTWSLWDTHSEDGVLQAYTPDELDEEVGLEGWAAALASVGWLAVKPGGLEMPGWEEHMSTSSKARDQAARRQTRKRDRDRQAPSRSGGDTPVTLHRDEPVTVERDAERDQMRGEERRVEENSESTPLSPPKGGRAKPEPWETLLDQDPLRSDPDLRDAWTEYHEHRRELGRQKRGVKPLTRASCASLLRRPSLQLAKALREAVEAGWQGVQLKNWTEWGEPINGQAPARAAPAKSFRQQERERGDAILRRYLDMPPETPEPREIEIEARP